MSLISFTALQDGVTSVNAAATNNPLNTIYNDYNGNITDANIASAAAIAASKVSFTGSKVWQYLGYAQITSNSTTSSSTPVVGSTQLAVSVVIPSGATAVKVTAFAINISTNNVGGAPIWWLYSGATVGTLTNNIQQTLVPNGAGATDSRTLIWVSNSAPTAGTIAYTMALSNTGGSVTTLSAAATTPAFVLVEVAL